MKMLPFLVVALMGLALVSESALANDIPAELVIAQEAYLKATNPETGDNFGKSVAVSGNTVVVGASGKSPASGSAFVFVFDGTSWKQQALLKASNAGAGDEFGGAVAISGDMVVIGAKREDSHVSGTASTQGQLSNSATDAGAIYEQAYLKASNTGTTDYFGYSVAISGDTIVVGAWGENHLAADAGAAYVFTRSTTIWSQQAYLKAHNAAEDADFGRSVAISGDRIIVGASGESNLAYGTNGVRLSDAIQSGAAYQFTRSAGLWTQNYYLKASNTTKSDYFGNSVAISADRVVVGAYFEDSTSTIHGYEGDQSENLEANTGAAYVFGEFAPVPPQEAFAKAMAAAGWTGPDADGTATPLDDGIPNLLKYASNLNLGFRDGRTLTYYWENAGLPLVRTVANGGATTFQVEYLRRRRSGLIYTPKVSSTLMPGSFMPLTGTPVVTPINDEWERIVIQEAADPLTSPTKFAVVEVSLP